MEDGKWQRKPGIIKSCILQNKSFFVCAALLHWRFIWCCFCVRFSPLELMIITGVQKQWKNVSKAKWRNNIALTRAHTPHKGGFQMDIIPMPMIKQVKEKARSKLVLFAFQMWKVPFYSNFNWYLCSLSIINFIAIAIIFARCKRKKRQILPNNVSFHIQCTWNWMCRLTTKKIMLNAKAMR